MCGGHKDHLGQRNYVGTPELSLSGKAEEGLDVLENLL